MATLMFWNKQHANANQNNEAKNGKKNWIHAPDSLINGHVAYLVKFLGSTPVDQAKGIETVKDAIRKLTFAQQMKKSDSGNNVKSKKVEITVSVDGVAVQEPRVQKVLHQFPLHNISYCADEKGVKKFFSFIAKTGSNASLTNGDTNNGSVNHNNNNTTEQETHECFVFISSKLASDITLTIGQAFELAYRRFMNDSGKVTEISKLQSHNKQLESTVGAYKQRLKDFVELLPKSDVDKLLLKYGLKDILEVPFENGIHNHTSAMNGNKTPDLDSQNNDDQLLIDTPSSKHFVPIVPPRNLQNQINSTLEALKPSVGTKLEGLLLNSDSDSDFDPRADECDLRTNGTKPSNDFFGFEPPITKSPVNQQQQQQQQQQAFSNSNHSNYNGSMTNGLNGITGSSPPLLAPPPKATTPRRTNVPNNNNNNNNINQDLFGSMPFSAPIQPSPFNDSIGSDVFNNSSINMNESIYDSSSTLNMNKNYEFKNPFNDSSSSSSSIGLIGSNNNNINSNSFNNINQINGINNNNNNNGLDGNNKNFTLSDLTTLSNNFDKLDILLKNNNINNKTIQNSQQNEKSNPFMMNNIGNNAILSSTAIQSKPNSFTTSTISNNKESKLNDLKGIELSKPNPFSHLSDENRFSYGMLSNTFDTVDIHLQSQHVDSQKPQQHQQQQQHLQQNQHQLNNGSSTMINDEKHLINGDLFKDAAVAAFNEFNKNKHEFSNKLADASTHIKIPFGNKNFNYVGFGSEKNLNH